MRSIVLAICLGMTSLLCSAIPGFADAGDELVGEIAPEFEVDSWVNIPDLTLEELRGKYVFVRFWTDNCPYCDQSAWSLNYFHRKFRDYGLQVIGIFHPKPPQVILDDRVVRAANRLATVFRLALTRIGRRSRLGGLERNNAI